MKPARRVAWIALAGWVGCAAPASDAPPFERGALASGGLETFATMSHTCAVVRGEVQCWGAAEHGQIGDGLLARRRPLPIRVTLPEPVERVAVGGSHSCAASSDRVFCWGDNAQRQAGPARPFVMLAPTPVAGLPGSITELAAGSDHTCAVADGKVWCWGRNEAGESGTAPAQRCRAPLRVRRCVQEVSPVRGLPDGVAVSALALGERHGCALVGGAVWCWGANVAGQRGDASVPSGPLATRVSGLAEPVTAIAAGARHTCALAASALRCWGANDAGQLGEVLDGVLAVAAGGARTCAVTSRGVLCWGDGDATPRAVPGLAGGVDALSVGIDSACARLVGGEVRCWGENDVGQLGTGDPPRGRDRALAVASWDDGRLRDLDGDGRITVVCLGDSNTQAQHGAPPPWCDRLRSRLPAEGWRVVNRGLGGATASASLRAAEWPVAYAIENDAPDVAILAYGSNDVFANTPTAEIVAAYGTHMHRLAEAGVPTLVALTPPVRSEEVKTNAAIVALNDGLRAAFPAERILDFASGVGDGELLDRVHLGESAQALRARVAAEALLRAAGEFPR